MLNDPGLTYSIESSTTSRPSRPLPDIRKQPTVYTVGCLYTEVLGYSEQWKQEKCPIYLSNHSLNKCREFLKKPFKDRKKLIRFKCGLTTNHTAKDCQAAVCCGDCGSQCHPTALHMVESSQGSQVKSVSFKKSSNVTPGKEHDGESTLSLNAINCAFITSIDIRAQRLCL